MTASMMHGDDEVVGSLTSGGTESILMAMKTYRDRAKKLFPHITKPNMVAAFTIHPAHEKAAHYFGFEIIHVPVNEEFKPNVREYENGASVVLYKDAELRKYQIFAYSGWPGGLFGSPSMAGTRPGGNIAAAWAALKSMGQDGYMAAAKKIMDTTVTLREGISQIPGLRVMGNPCMTAFAIQTTDPEIDILAVADVMEEKGWKLERQQKPPSLHFTIMPHHTAVVNQIVEVFAQTVKEVKNNKALSKKGSAAMYGMVANIPDQSLVDDFIVEFFSEVYKV